VRQAIQTTRDLTRGLAPLGLTRGGLPDALRQLAAAQSRTAGIAVRFRSRGTRGHRFSDDTAMHLYRIAQEAMTNALKHARARVIDVELVVTQQQVRLTVADDGRGIRPERGTTGLGLRTMKYRAGAIGGALTIERRGTCGTRVSCVQFKRRPARKHKTQLRPLPDSTSPLRLPLRSPAADGRLAPREYARDHD
jgi:signal transduction histidine kinase